jgi:hypothetical protein
LIPAAILSLPYMARPISVTLRTDQQRLCVRLPLIQTFALGSLAEEKSENGLRKYLILPVIGGFPVLARSVLLREDRQYQLRDVRSSL